LSGPLAPALQPARLTSRDENEMNDKNYLLAIDNGTQSVRALLFDLQGNL
ncbi:hypothetical protein IH693_26330, partial [Escherichia coli]|nr:hypothetical protein [Escherichia coli]